jgi:ABC-type bacteriocin/lantibiotic exporter with double-glycine peptidase domain
LFYIDVRLALVCMTGAPVVLYPLVRLGQRVRRMTRRGQEDLEQISHVTAEAFSGHRSLGMKARMPVMSHRTSSLERSGSLACWIRMPGRMETSRRGGAGSSPALTARRLSSR